MGDPYIISSDDDDDVESSATSGRNATRCSGPVQSKLDKKRPVKRRKSSDTDSDIIYIPTESDSDSDTPCAPSCNNPSQDVSSRKDETSQRVSSECDPDFAPSDIKESPKWESSTNQEMLDVSTGIRRKLPIIPPKMDDSDSDLPDVLGKNKKDSCEPSTSKVKPCSVGHQKERKQDRNKMDKERTLRDPRGSECRPSSRVVRLEASEHGRQCKQERRRIEEPEAQTDSDKNHIKTDEDLVERNEKWKKSGESGNRNKPVGSNGIGGGSANGEGNIETLADFFADTHGESQVEPVDVHFEDEQWGSLDLDLHAPSPDVTDHTAEQSLNGSHSISFNASIPKNSHATSSGSLSQSPDQTLNQSGQKHLDNQLPKNSSPSAVVHSSSSGDSRPSRYSLQNKKLSTSRGTPDSLKLLLKDSPTSGWRVSGQRQPLTRCSSKSDQSPQASKELFDQSPPRHERSNDGHVSSLGTPSTSGADKEIPGDRTLLEQALRYKERMELCLYKIPLSHDFKLESICGSDSSPGASYTRPRKDIVVFIKKTGRGLSDSTDDGSSAKDSDESEDPEWNMDGGRRMLRDRRRGSKRKNLSRTCKVSSEGYGRFNEDFEDTENSSNDEEFFPQRSLREQTGYKIPQKKKALRLKRSCSNEEAMDTTSDEEIHKRGRLLYCRKKPTVSESENDSDKTCIDGDDQKTFNQPPAIKSEPADSDETLIDSDDIKECSPKITSPEGRRDCKCETSTGSALKSPLSGNISVRLTPISVKASEGQDNDTSSNKTLSMEKKKSSNALKGLNSPKKGSSYHKKVTEDPKERLRRELNEILGNSELQEDQLSNNSSINCTKSERNAKRKLNVTGKNGSLSTKIAKSGKLKTTDTIHEDHSADASCTAQTTSSVDSALQRKFPSLHLNIPVDKLAESKNSESLEDSSAEERTDTSRIYESVQAEVCNDPHSKVKKKISDKKSNSAPDEIKPRRFYGPSKKIKTSQKSSTMDNISPASHSTTPSGRVQSWDEFLRKTPNGKCREEKETVSPVCTDIHVDEMQGGEKESDDENESDAYDNFSTQPFSPVLDDELENSDEANDLYTQPFSPILGEDSESSTTSTTDKVMENKTVEPLVSLLSTDAEEQDSIQPSALDHKDYFPTDSQISSQSSDDEVAPAIDDSVDQKAIAGKMRSSESPIEDRCSPTEEQYFPTDSQVSTYLNSEETEGQSIQQEKPLDDESQGQYFPTDSQLSIDLNSQDPEVSNLEDTISNADPQMPSNSTMGHSSGMGDDQEGKKKLLPCQKNAWSISDLDPQQRFLYLEAADSEHMFFTPENEEVACMSLENPSTSISSLENSASKEQSDEVPHSSKETPATSLSALDKSAASRKNIQQKKNVQKQSRGEKLLSAMKETDNQQKSARKPKQNMDITSNPTSPCHNHGLTEETKAVKDSSSNPPPLTSAGLKEAAGTSSSSLIISPQGSPEPHESSMSTNLDSENISVMNAKCSSSLNLKASTLCTPSPTSYLESITESSTAEYQLGAAGTSGDKSNAAKTRTNNGLDRLNSSPASVGASESSTAEYQLGAAGTSADKSNAAKTRTNNGLDRLNSSPASVGGSSISGTLSVPTHSGSSRTALTSSSGPSSGASCGLSVSQLCPETSDRRIPLKKRRLSGPPGASASHQRKEPTAVEQKINKELIQEDVSLKVNKELIQQDVPLKLNKELRREDILSCILSWDTDWYQKHREVPSTEVLGSLMMLGELPKNLDSYPDVTSYQEAFICFLIIQMWTKVSTSVARESHGLWKQSSQVIVSQDITKVQYEVDENQTEPHGMRRGDLVLIDMTLISAAQKQYQFGLVQIAESGARTVCLALRKDAIVPNTTKLKPVASLAHSLNQMEALLSFSSHPLARHIIKPDDPTVFTNSEETQHIQLSDEDLRDAYMESITSNDKRPEVIRLMNGLPGTGKTTFLHRLVRWITRKHKPRIKGSKNQYKILVCAPASQSLDVLLRKIWDSLIKHSTLTRSMAAKNLKHIVDGIEIIRVGEAEQADRRLTDFCLSNVVKRMIEQGAPYNKMTEEELQIKILQKADVVGCTLEDCGMEVVKDSLAGNVFALVIDDASHCLETEILLALQCKTKRVFMAGDQDQGIVHIHSQELKDLGYGRSMLERLAENFEIQDRRIHRWEVQYRMKEEIARFPSSCMYFHRLETQAKDVPFFLKPYIVFDVGDGRESEKQESVINISEVSFIGELVSGFPKEQYTLGIIAPSVGQKTKLQERFQGRQGQGILIGTPTDFYGIEKDVIIFSCTFTSDDNRLKMDKQTMNLALTRAKHSLIIVCNRKGLMKMKGHWESLMTDATERQLVYRTLQASYRADAASCHSKTTHPGQNTSRSLPDPRMYSNKPMRTIADGRSSTFAQGEIPSIDGEDTFRHRFNPDLQKNPGHGGPMPERPQRPKHPSSDAAGVKRVHFEAGTKDNEKARKIPRYWNVPQGNPGGQSFNASSASLSHSMPSLSGSSSSYGGIIKKPVAPPIQISCPVVNENPMSHNSRNHSEKVVSPDGFPSKDSTAKDQQVSHNLRSQRGSGSSEAVNGTTGETLSTAQKQKSDSMFDRDSRRIPHSGDRGLRDNQRTSDQNKDVTITSQNFGKRTSPRMARKSSNENHRTEGNRSSEASSSWTCHNSSKQNRAGQDKSMDRVRQENQVDQRPQQTNRSSETGTSRNRYSPSRSRAGQAQRCDRHEQENQASHRPNQQEGTVQRTRRRCHQEPPQPPERQQQRMTSLNQLANNPCHLDPNMQHNRNVHEQFGGRSTTLTEPQPYVRRRRRSNYVKDLQMDFAD